jgi:Protein of unknown function (DUF962)
MPLPPDTKRRVPRPGGPPALESWLARHQRPSNFYLHVVGIPMTMAAVPAVLRRRWTPAAVLFLGGYAAQVVGHALEGEPPGEVMAIKRLVGRSPPRGR